jgi:hypothetical protein
MILQLENVSFICTVLQHYQCRTQPEAVQVMPSCKIILIKFKKCKIHRFFFLNNIKCKCL